MNTMNCDNGTKAVLAIDPPDSCSECPFETDSRHPECPVFVFGGGGTLNKQSR